MSDSVALDAMDTTTMISEAMDATGPIEAEPHATGIPALLDAMDTLDELATHMAAVPLTPKQLGSCGERYAAAWLQRLGHTILDRNWRSRYGELDIIALSPERTVLFVEVKTRRNARFGTPQEAVTAHKRLNLRRASVQWLLEPGHRIAHTGVRFDVIGITAPIGGTPVVNHIREAF